MTLVYLSDLVVQTNFGLGNATVNRVDLPVDRIVIRGPFFPELLKITNLLLSPVKAWNSLHKMWAACVSDEGRETNSVI